MRNKKLLISEVCFLSVLGFFLATLSAYGQGGSPQVEVIPEVHHDVSPPLRDIAPIPPGKERHVHPVHPIHELNPNAQLQEDPVVQTAVGSFVVTTNIHNFAGVGDGAYGFTPNAAPPDTNGAVGATQFVQWVNESFAVFDKATGNLLHGPVTGNTL